MEAETEYCSSSVKSSWGTVSCYYERDQLSKLDTMQWRMKRDLGSERGDLWQSMRVYSVAAKSAARLCLVPRKVFKIFTHARHIESYDTCMEY